MQQCCFSDAFTLCTRTHTNSWRGGEIVGFRFAEKNQVFKPQTHHISTLSNIFGQHLASVIIIDARCTCVCVHA